MDSRAPSPDRALVAVLLLGLAACGGDGGQDDARAADGAAGSDDDVPARAAAGDTTCAALTSVSPDSMRVTDSGLRLLQLAEGTGAAAASGDRVTVHYLGCLTDGTKFDASHDRAEPITFVLGRGRVIQGWDEGLEGLRSGGIRYLRIPPELGYGARGTPGGPIPPNSTLLFEVEMVEVRPPAGGSDGT